MLSMTPMRLASLKCALERADLFKRKLLCMTLGTGIGSAIFVRGELLPNTELGHLEIRGKIAERRASDAIRQKKDLSWKKWSVLLQEYLDEVEFLFSPDILIVGGGASKYHEKFFPHLHVHAQLLPAEHLNLAGIIGLPGMRGMLPNKEQIALLLIVLKTYWTGISW